MKFELPLKDKEDFEKRTFEKGIQERNSLSKGTEAGKLKKHSRTCEDEV